MGVHPGTLYGEAALQYQREAGTQEPRQHAAAAQPYPGATLRVSPRVDPKPFSGGAPYDLVQPLHNCEARLHTEPIGMVRRLADFAEVDAQRQQLWAFARASAGQKSNM